MASRPRETLKPKKRKTKRKSPIAKFGRVGVTFRRTPMSTIMVVQDRIKRRADKAKAEKEAEERQGKLFENI